MANGNGTHARAFTRQVMALEKRAKALQLRQAGLSYEQIAKACGYNSPHAAYKAIKSAMKFMLEEPTRQLRSMEKRRLDDLYSKAYQVLTAFHPVIGRVSRDQDGVLFMTDKATGEHVPLKDSGPVLSAIDKLLKIQERRAKLLGLDAPAKVDAKVDAGLVIVQCPFDPELVTGGPPKVIDVKAEMKALVEANAGNGENGHDEDDPVDSGRGQD